ncbi:MAG: pseudouridylate synthase [Bacteroidales bacterium]|nr:pseudouridylate synthase [Bacteroidales bacterium]
MDDFIITDLIPQKPPFVFVDHLISYDKKTAVSTFLIKENGIFVENNLFQEGGIMENIAQTCAARIGYINKHLQGGNIKIGVIGGIKNLTIYQLPKVGSLLKTSINDMFEDFDDVKILEAKVQCDDTLIASCEIKVALLNL